MKVLSVSSESAITLAVPRKSLGERKTVIGRIPIGTHAAFDKKRLSLGLGQNEALVAALEAWAIQASPEPPSLATVMEGPVVKHIAKMGEQAVAQGVKAREAGVTGYAMDGSPIYRRGPLPKSKPK